MARPATARGVTPGLPAGRVAAIRQASHEVAEPLTLVPGAREVTLLVSGLPVPELPDGTRLRIGPDAVVEIGGPAASGVAIVDADAGAPPVPSRVVVAGPVRRDDGVAIEAVVLPLEAILDLHPFRPDEVADVVGEYLARAGEAGLATARIVHGRGRGVQRALVRGILARSPLVAEFHDAPPEDGGWGATIVRFRPARG